MSEHVRDHPQFEPEVEALLREIARDPRSCLLRVPRPAVSRTAVEEQPHVMAGATGLTAAERQLLLVHRADAAQLLRELCRRRLMDEFFLSGAIGPDWNASRRMAHAVSDEEWERSAKAELAFAADAAGDLEAYRLLQQCVARGPGTNASVADVAAASLRLEPSDEARIYVALDQISDGALRSAEAGLHQVIQGTTRRQLASIAWEDVGLARWCENDAERALEMYQRSAAVDPTRWMPILESFVTAVMLGLTDTAMRWSRVLDELVVPDHEAIDRACRTLAGRRTIYEQQARLHAREVVRQTGDSMGPTSWRIIDVLR